MSITEAAKHDVYKWFEEAMGKERATTLMAMVSPTGWADVATKQDLTHEVTLLRTEMAAEFKQVRTEMAAEFKQVRTEMAAEFKEVRTEMNGEIAGLRNELGASFERGLRTQLFAIYAFNGIFMSLAVGLAQAIN